MNKICLIQKIVESLSADLEILFTAAKSAHQASTHEENIPDNKYDTLALEASYLAQGQANRAEQIRRSIEIYRQLQLNESEGGQVRLTSLVTLQDRSGTKKILFIGPLEGGMKIEHEDNEIVVISPASPMGRGLLGSSAGETVEVKTGSTSMEYEIVEVS